MTKGLLATEAAASDAPDYETTTHNQGEAELLSRNEPLLQKYRRHYGNRQRARAPEPGSAGGFAGKCSCSPTNLEQPSALPFKVFARNFGRLAQ